MASTTAACSSASTSYNWTFSGNSDPCSLSLSYLQICNASAILPPLTSSSEYEAPAAASLANACVCSGTYYNLLSACSACQAEGGLNRWPEYSVYTQNCPTSLLFSGPSTLPNETIPSWASLDPSTYLNDTWSPSLAYSVSKSDVILPSMLASSVKKAKHDKVAVGALVGATIGAFIAGLLAAVLTAVWYNNLDIKAVLQKENRRTKRFRFKRKGVPKDTESNRRLDGQSQASRDHLPFQQTPDGLQPLRPEPSLGSNDQMHGGKNLSKPVSQDTLSTARLPQRYRSNSSNLNTRVGMTSPTGSETIEEIEMKTPPSTSSGGFAFGQVGQRQGFMRSDSDRSGSSHWGKQPSLGMRRSRGSTFDQSTEFLHPRTPPNPLKPAQVKQEFIGQGSKGRVKYTPPTQDTKPLNLTPKGSFDGTGRKVSQYWPDNQTGTFDGRSNSHDGDIWNKDRSRKNSNSSSGKVYLRPTGSPSGSASRTSSSASREPRPDLVSILKKSQSSGQIRRQAGQGSSTNPELPSESLTRSRSQPAGAASLDSLSSQVPLPRQQVIGGIHPYAAPFPPQAQSQPQLPTQIHSDSQPHSHHSQPQSQPQFQSQPQHQQQSYHSSNSGQLSRIPPNRNEIDPNARKETLLRVYDQSHSDSTSSGSGSGGNGNHFMRFLSDASKGKRQPPLLLSPEAPLNTHARDGSSFEQSEFGKSSEQHGPEMDARNLRNDPTAMRDPYLEESPDPSHSFQQSVRPPNQPSPERTRSQMSRSPPPFSQFQLQRQLSRNRGQSPTSQSSTTSHATIVAHNHDQSFVGVNPQRGPFLPTSSQFSDYTGTPESSLRMARDQESQNMRPNLDESQSWEDRSNYNTSGDEEFSMVTPSEDALPSSQEEEVYRLRPGQAV